jgi:hypothetical protein
MIQPFIVLLIVVLLRAVMPNNFFHPTPVTLRHFLMRPSAGAAEERR